MKKLLYTLAAVLVSHLVVGQTDTKNYVRTTTYQSKTQDGTTNATTGQTLTDDEKIESITYFDGLGRPVQSIAKQAGGNKEHIVTPVVYDALGRQPKDYLPYAYSASSGTALNYLPPLDVLEDLEGYYVSKYPEDQITGTTINAYSEKVFEASPLNRVLEQGAPGNDWLANPLSDTDHTIKFGYQTNTANEVELFRVIFPTLNTEKPQLYYDGFYQANELYKTITKDENWQPTQAHLKAHTTEEFKNSLGQVVLKRTYNNNTAHNTYYVYDDFGNLTYVLSPKGSDLVLYDNKFVDYYNVINYIEFVPLDKFGNPETGGKGEVSVDVDKDLLKLSITFDLSFDTAIELKNGSIAELSEYLPNMIIGQITSGGVNYMVSVQDGYLYIAGTGLLSGVSESFILDLPTQSIEAETIDALCYQYRYDKRNRLVEKKIPQKGWEYIVYDKLDRPVLTQDALLRASNHWLFTKYDAFDRVAYTGLFSDFNPTALTRLELQSMVDAQTVFNEEQVQTLNYVGGWSLYYTNNVLQLPSATLLFDLYTVNYYDTYNPELTAVAANPSTVLGQTVSTATKSLPTGSKIKVLGTDDWITSVTYYDDKARPIYMASKNDYLITTDVVSTQLDFIGKTIKTESSHTKGTNPAIVVTDDYTYDHAGRLLTQKQKIGTGAQELIAKNTYDELGQLESKKVGNTETAPLQTVDYGYNIRGWLKQINDPLSLGNDLFSFAINYNTSSLGQGDEKLYNGNISETLWKTANDVPSNTIRGYAYEYDALNRLNTANMSISTGSGFALASGYHENGLLYDKNGNIMSLQRTGATTVFDNLSYIYNGNQLSRVTDAITDQQTEGFIDGNTVGNDYTYDANGNMKTDKNKGITNITYNHLNLPTQVNFGATNNIQYVYDATGVKLKKRVGDKSQTTFTSYAGNYIYEDTGIETLKFFSHPEGYVEPDGQGNYDYIYQYKDHLGNIRLSYNETASTSVSESFSGTTYDWVPPGSGSINSNNDKMNISIANKWNAAAKYMDIIPGETLKISFDFDKGTMGNPYLFILERINGVWEPQANRDVFALQTGHFEVELMLTGDHVLLYFEKGNSTDDGILTSCSVDNFSVSQTLLEIIEENNYYPFGLKHKGYNNVSTSSNIALKRMFGGKEYQDELGLGWYDVSARNYDPALGRWMNLDPLAEQMRRHSPYNYAFDNPIYFIDADGMMPTGSTNPDPTEKKVNKPKIPDWSPDAIKWSIISYLANAFSSDDDDKSSKKSNRSSNSSSSGRRSSSGRDGGGGFSFVDDSGQASGDQDLIRKGSGDTQTVNVEGFIALATVASGKGKAKGDGRTNAKDISKKNVADAFAEGVESTGYFSLYVDASTQAINTGGSIDTGNKDNDSKATRTTYVEGGMTIVKKFDSGGEAKKDSIKQMKKGTLPNGFKIDSITIDYN